MTNGRDGTNRVCGGRYMIFGNALGHEGINGLSLERILKCVLLKSGIEECCVWAGVSVRWRDHEIKNQRNFCHWSFVPSCSEQLASG